MYRDLPFPPPSPRKDVLAAAPEPGTFGADVHYLGDWKEGLWPCCRPCDRGGRAGAYGASTCSRSIAGRLSS